MKVNSSKVVTNLNADKVDGSDANQLAPNLRAQQDPTILGSEVSGTTQVNSVSISAPVSGVLIISGIAFVNNQHTSVLNPKVDGSGATLPGWGDLFEASAYGSNGEKGGLSYTLSEPVSAGSHTVTQELGKSGGDAAATCLYNNNELSVQFVPGTQASVQ